VQPTKERADGCSFLFAFYSNYKGKKVKVWTLAIAPLT